MSVSSRTRSKLKQREEAETATDRLVKSKLKQRDEAEATSDRLVKLPEEILHNEIFLKLPGKSILASRCVCKLLYNLLSSPNFIKIHLDNSIQSKNNPNILCFHRSVENKPPRIYSIPIDYASISSTSSSADGAILINYPFESNKNYGHEILGTCNGLVCLKIESFDGPGKNRRRDSVHYSIINPLTGEYKDFLGPRNHGLKPRGPSCKVTYGFGYNSNLDDYKLVMMWDFQQSGFFKIDVYGLKSKKWNSMQDYLNYLFRCETCERYDYCIADKVSHGVSLNGSLHWLGFLGSKATQETSSKVIICFDISNETMVDMPLPENIIPPTRTPWEMHMFLGVWGDCICVTCTWGLTKTEVWVMQEYGVKESWIRKYTQTRNHFQILAIRRPFLPCWQPLWCFHNGEILVNDGRQRFLLYDPTTDTIRSAAVRDITMDEHQESYAESLVSLDSGTYMEKQITHGILKILK